MTRRVLLLNGPNLNMLGTRQPEIYGTQTLDDIVNTCRERAASLDIELEAKQSNLEGDLVTWIQETPDGYDGIIINAGAYTHTSVAIRDALALTQLPIIELHISNIHQRESFRHVSLISGVATGCIVGLGTQGYVLALEALHHLFTRNIPAS